jgi:hypothetical protein
MNENSFDRPTATLGKLGKTCRANPFVTAGLFQAQDEISGTFEDIFYSRSSPIRKRKLQGKYSFVVTCFKFILTVMFAKKYEMY